MNVIDSTVSPKPRPVVLCVLDGWGHRDEAADNAIAAAATPVWDRLLAENPHALLDTSGRTVGLPDGQMGNSEVGHMNLGAGRVVEQDLPRIDRAIESGALAGNPVLGGFIDKLLDSGGVCHLLGLVSPGGVHSHQDHIVTLARLVAARGIPVAIHGFLDGRDTPPQSAAGYVARTIAALKDYPAVTIATLSGRFYAMDRDRRWDRVARAYACLAEGQGDKAGDPVAAIRAGYERGLGDEFLEPTVIGAYSGMADGDGLLMANFRADRARQILTALTKSDFKDFERGPAKAFAAAAGMVEYSSALAPAMTALFDKPKVVNGLGEIVARAGLRQLRIAETEKYAHVTFFFNGGGETVLAGEDRILVPSPKVATYDLQPEMSAPEVTDRLVEAIATGDYDFILVNYANPDMVGHTGVMAAAKAAVECIDQCLARVAGAVAEARGALLITADHGNVEMMRDSAASQPHTAHTTNRVPLILFNAARPGRETALNDGRLADVAPTLLELLGLSRPGEMTGRSLIGAAAKSPPVSRRARMVALAIAAAMVLAPLSGARAQDKPSEELLRVETEIEQHREIKRGLDGKVTKLSGEVDVLTQQLIEAANAIQGQEESVSAVEVKLDELTENERRNSAELEERTRQLGHSLAALQRLSRQPNLVLIGRPASAVESLRAAGLLSRVVPELQIRADELGRAIKALHVLRADIEVERGQLADQTGRLNRERERIDALWAKKAAQETEASQEARTELRRIEDLGRQAADLRALIARLEAEEQDAWQRRDEVARARPDAGRPFSSVRGSLALPARGQLVRRYNQPDENGQATKGIVIETRPGAQVTAPHDGKIVFAGPFRNYGQLLIISHGEGYHTVLVGLSRIDGVVGQWLLTGEPVGQMATVDPAGEPGPKPTLYIEIRRNGDPVNPMVWLAQSEGKVSG